MIEISRDSVRFSRVNGIEGVVEILAKDKVMLIHFSETSAPAKKTIKKDTSSIPKTPLTLDVFDERRNGGPSNAVFSMVLPGWGDYKVRQIKKPYWVIGLVSCSLLGGGIYYKTRSDKLYADYKSSHEIDYSTYNLANDYHKRYLVMTSLAAAIWLTDVILVVNKGQHNRKSKQPASLVNQIKHPTLFISPYCHLGLKWNIY